MLSVPDGIVPPGLNWSLGHVGIVYIGQFWPRARQAGSKSISPNERRRNNTTLINLTPSIVEPLNSVSPSQQPGPAD